MRDGKRIAWFGALVVGLAAGASIGSCFVDFGRAPTVADTGGDAQRRELGRLGVAVEDVEARVEALERRLSVPSAWPVARQPELSVEDAPGATETEAAARSSAAAERTPLAAADDADDRGRDDEGEPVSSVGAFLFGQL